MSRVKRISLYAMAAFYVAGGVNHFANPDFYVNLMPPYLPWHLELVYASGVAEIGLGLALLVPRLRTLAAWGVIALLIAVLPANVHVAVNDVPMLGSEQGLGMWNWARVAFQGVLIAWAHWHTRD